MTARGVWPLPEGLRVDEDGTWKVGEQQVLHPPTLRYIKQHLVFEPDGVFVEDAGRRVAVEVLGPAFVAVSLVLDPARGEAHAVLDDGSDEPVTDESLGMNEVTGRFECVVRSGKARAVLSRGAHQTLIENVEDRGGRFVLQVGDRALSIRA